MEISACKSSFIALAFEFEFKAILKKHEVVCISYKH